MRNLIWLMLFILGTGPQYSSGVMMGATQTPSVFRVEDVAGVQVALVPMLPASFAGDADGDWHKGEVVRCKVGAKALGPTYVHKGVTVPVTQVELVCESGLKKVLLTGVSFQ